MRQFSRPLHTKMANSGIPKCTHFHAIATQKWPTWAYQTAPTFGMTLGAFFDLMCKFHALSTQKWPTMAYRNAPIFTPSPHKNGQLGRTEMHPLSRHCHTKMANLGVPNCTHFRYDFGCIF